MKRVGAVSFLVLLAAGCRPAMEFAITATPVPPLPTLAAPVLTATFLLVPTDTQAASPTITPTSSLTASLTPTLGPLRTWTPSPAARCPDRSAQASLETDFDIEAAERAILQYLNRGGDPAQLESLLRIPADAEPGAYPSLQAIAFSTDVTGDRIDDYVLQVNANTQDQASTAILALTCREGVVETAFAERFPYLDFAFPNLVGIIDLNANGVPEIVYSVEEFGAGADSSTSFFLVEWDGQTFRQLVSNSEEFFYYPNAASMGNLAELGSEGPYEHSPDLDKMFPDMDGNGTRELVLTGGISGRYWTMGGGPERSTTDTWAWNGEAFTLLSSEFGPPEFRFQAVRDGDAATSRGEYEKALGFYQRAVFDESLYGWNPERLHAEYNAYLMGTPTPLPLPEERPRLNAYGRYRILLIHAIGGNGDAAELVYQTLRSKVPAGSPGYPYVELADAFWEGSQAGADPSAGCESARTYAAEHHEEVLGPLGSSIYWFFYEDYSTADVCPID